MIILGFNNTKEEGVFMTIGKTVVKEEIIKKCNELGWDYVDHIQCPHPDDHYTAYVTSYNKETNSYQNHLYNAQDNGFHWGRYDYEDKEVCLEVMRSRIL
jgi:hypothetical protein